MGAATNVTTVHYGTTCDDSTLLEEVKQLNLELERKDGSDAISAATGRRWPGIIPTIFVTSRERGRGWGRAIPCF
jgi:hypothetical protein